MVERNEADLLSKGLQRLYSCCYCEEGISDVGNLLLLS